MARRLLVIVVATGLVVAIIVSALLLRANDGFGSNTGSVDSTLEPPNTNSSSKNVRLEEFCDYESVPCAELHPPLKKLRAEFGPNLNFVFRNLPMGEVHKNALAAARAAEAARKQNKFWEMHDALYENQQAWKDEKNPRPVFMKLATDIGLDIARFTQDMDDEQILFRIEADRDEAVRLGVDATPTIYLDGRKLRAEALTLEGMRRGIEITRSRE